MISIYDLFENGELILQETLIDSIFKYVDYVKLEDQISDDGLLDLQDDTGTKFNIDLRYHQNPNPNYKVVTGQFIKPNIIILILPNQKEDILKLKGKDIVNVFLHEFTHMLTYQKIPKLVTVNGKPFKTTLIPPPFSDINFEDDKEKIKSLLDYIFQLREMPNFAFSIGFDLINYTKQTTEELYQSNRFIIKQEKESGDKFNRNQYYYNLTINLKTFFEIQYFTDKIHKLEYSRKFIKMRKMIEKYRRRLKMYIK